MSNELINRVNSSYSLSNGFNWNSLDLSSFYNWLGVLPNTVRTYNKSLKHFIQWLYAQQNIQDINPSVIDKYREDLKATGKKDTTIHLYITAVIRLFQYLNATGLYPNAIAQPKAVKNVKVDRESPKAYFDAEQVKTILNTVKQDNSSIAQRDYLMLKTMFITGLRTIEVSRLKRSDIQLSGSRYVLLIQGKGHTAKDDFVPLDNRLAQELLRYCDNKDPQSPIFTSLGGRAKGDALTTKHISRICKTRFKEAGFDNAKWTAHSTRHTTAMLAISHGQSVEEVQQTLRHSSANTTAIYLHQYGKTENRTTSIISSLIEG